MIEKCGAERMSVVVKREADAAVLCRQAAAVRGAAARGLYEQALILDAECVEALCGLADGLQAAGCLEDAVGYYRRALSVRPDHAVVANNLGNALQKLDRFEDAISCYRDALTAKSDSVEIRINLGRALDSARRQREAIEEFGKALELAPRSAEIHYRIGRVLENIPFLNQARAYYEKALALDPGHSAAQQALGNVLADLGLEDEAWKHRRKGYARDVFTTRPAVHNDRPIRVLKLISAAGGNVPLDLVLTPSRFEVSSLVVEFADRLPPTEQFDVIVNAVGDADRRQLGLRAVHALLQDCLANVINTPARVLDTRREVIAARLGSITGVRSPRLVTLPRSLFEMDQAAAALAGDGWTCPLLLRVLGHHTGHHFVRVDSFDQMTAAALSLPGDRITAIEWLDTRGPDSRFRKYRVMFLGGNLYPLHLAVSQQWKVHYYSANMADNADFRAEELRFLSDCAAVAGADGIAALHEIGNALGLDYAGLDFALGQSGEILVFEANATMRIIAPPPNPMWDYRRVFVDRALTAARDLFTR
jgi:Tfp pilus assembly protein PilF